MGSCVAGGDEKYARLYASFAVAAVMLGAAVTLMILRRYTVIVVVWIVFGILCTTLIAASVVYLGLTAMYFNGFKNWLDDDQASPRDPTFVRGLISQSSACRRPAFAFALFLAAVVSGGVVLIMVKEGAVDALLDLDW